MINCEYVVKCNMLFEGRQVDDNDNDKAVCYILAGVAAIQEAMVTLSARVVIRNTSQGSQYSFSG